MIAAFPLLAGCSVLSVITLGTQVETKAIGNEVTPAAEFAVGSTTEGGTQKMATDEGPTLDGEHVTLAIPDELFASTGILSLRLSEIIGPFIMRSAARLAQLTRFVQPLFGGNLEIKIPKDME